MSDRHPMSVMMVQAFLRELVGRFDVAEIEIHRMGEGQLLIVDPHGEDLVYDVKGGRA